ncbi:hypothetical protein [Acanthopleuribacter pedis]|uniref:Uncharacterized protein n=1 Tax=Acanthopleuribacter pedis TaxID=442870 RepID=A0A8J7QC28_9BACT|nr:hypothetical protein [Acanthopleuribacter pedis]MBO1323392.1 hypothetical protein [Acanthopleuribacter pedis]
MSQNGQDTQQASPEGLAFVLVLVVVCLRFLYETQVLLNFLDLSFPALNAQDITALLAHVGTHPALYFFCLFCFPLVYLPLHLLFRLGGLITPKTTDLSKGSIAQGELDD